MAISQYNTLGLLNYWSIRMKENTYHFNQMAGVQAPLTFAGSYGYIQSERDSIAEGILTALPSVITQLGYYPRPVYLVDKIKLGSGFPFQVQSLKTRYGYIQAIGRRATSVIQAAASVVYSGNVATITVTTSVTDPDEVQVFFRTSDGATSAASDDYRIEPLRVSIGGGTATITGHRALFCLPSVWATEYDPPNYNASDKNIVDSNDAANYVTAVDVYRVYPDATSAVTLLRDEFTYDGLDSTTDLETTGQAKIQNSELGFINLRLGSNEAATYYPYQYAEVYYYAGYPLTNGQPDPMLRNAILGFANCELNNTLTCFDHDRLSTFQYDIAVETAENQLLSDSPFGRKRGQVQAWRVLNRYALGKGGAMI